MFNLYLKYWNINDVNGEVAQFHGIRFSKHRREKKDYKAWSLDVVIRNKCMLSFTLTNNHKNYYKANKRDWPWEASWSLFHRNLIK